MKKINLEKISEEQLEQERNPNYKYFDIKNKQTAVEWFVEQLKNEEGIDFIPSRIIERAKQMEKDQIINAYKRESAYMKHVGCTDEMIDKSSIKYYNETYRK